MTPTDYISASGVVVVVVLAVIASARSQAAIREIVQGVTKKLALHSGKLDKAEVDLVRTTIRSEKNEEAIVEIKDTLREVRDAVMEIRAEMRHGNG